MHHEFGVPCESSNLPLFLFVMFLVIVIVPVNLGELAGATNHKDQMVGVTRSSNFVYTNPQAHHLGAF